MKHIRPINFADPSQESGVRPDLFGMAVCDYLGYHGCQTAYAVGGGGGCGTGCGSSSGGYQDCSSPGTPGYGGCTTFTCNRGIGYQPDCDDEACGHVGMGLEMPDEPDGW